MKRKALVVGLLLAVVMTVCLVGPVVAQYSESGGKIDTALGSVIKWLTMTLGGAMVVVGLILTGIRMAAGDEYAIKKGAWVIVGGIIIFLSSNILGLIRGFAGK